MTLLGTNTIVEFRNEWAIYFYELEIITSYNLELHVILRHYLVNLIFIKSC